MLNVSRGTSAAADDARAPEWAPDRSPAAEPIPSAADYDAFLREIVKEQDFTMFRPWRLGRAEELVAWQHRVVETAARAYRKDPRDVLSDLERALQDRHRHNRKRWLARLPALLTLIYVTRLQSRVTKGLVLPFLQWRYVRRANDLAARGCARLCRRSTTSAPMASIVVLSFNRLAYLRSTLASLAATTNRDDYELIVVDNGSTDGSAEFLRAVADDGAIDKLILSRRNRGTSAGFNLGFAVASRSTKYLVKLDSDIVILAPGWLQRFDAFLTNVPDVGVVAMGLVNHHVYRLAPRDRVAGEKVVSWNYWVGGAACMTIPRALFEELGYFREHDGFKYMPDDVDYAARVALARRRAFYLCETRAYHRHDLDHDYPALEEQKKRELPANRKAMRAIYADYVIGARDFFVPPPGLGLAIPEGRRILELED